MHDKLDQDRTLWEGLFDYLSILLKYRWLILGITAAASIGVIAFCAASIFLPPGKSPLPNVYTASAVILIQRGAENDMSSSIRSALGIVSSPADLSTGFDTSAFLLMVLQSRTFLDKIADEFGIVQKYRLAGLVKSRSRKILLANLHFENNRPAAAMTISYTDTDPVFAKNLTNRVVSLLSEWYSQNMGSSTLRQKQLLQDKIDEAKANVDKLEDRESELKKRYGVFTAQDLGASQASALAALRSQLILKEIDIKNYESIAAPEDAKLQQLQKERQNILDLINRTQKGMPEIQGNRAGLESPDAQTEFNNLSTELDVQRKIYNTLSHQFEALKLTSDPEPPFQVMEFAEVPDAKSGPQRTKIIARVVLMAFLASAALSFLLNAISQERIRAGSYQVREAIARLPWRIARKDRKGTIPKKDN
jgi:uncharacterized protein involved in exopolysaccharide biosynthesis